MMLRNPAAVVAVAALVIGPAVASAAPPQQAPAGTAQESGKSVSEILLKIEPPPPTPADSITVDDLRDLPRPHGDRFPHNIRIRVGVEDPRCLPGDELLLDRMGRPLRRPLIPGTPR